MGKKKSIRPELFSIKCKTGDDRKEFKFFGSFEKVAGDTIQLFSDKYGYDIGELIGRKRKTNGTNNKKE
ncbi:MAG TPA: hypothetical protein PLG47_03535 [Candidatus Dojkabacteria bacterium]|nr:hypothetical protein [Candidatus Dojkabacteria bacterium]